MGICRDFGSQITEGCDHPMRAASDSCHCEECGVVCKGKFEACPAVWALGPQPVVLASEPADGMLEGPNYETLAVNVQEAPAGHKVGPSVAEGARAATNGHASVPSSPPPAAQAGSESAAEAFRWFQNAFDALRQEVAGLRIALAQEQTLVATLLEIKVAETARDTESERAVLETTVREAVKQESRGLGPTLEALRNDIEVVRSAQEKLEAGLQLEADIAGANRAELLTGLSAEMNRRDSANRKAFRATLAQELQPLVEVVAESVAQSEFQLQVIDRKIDTLSESGASLAATVAEVAESVEAITVIDPAANEAVDEAETTPIRRRLRESAEGRVEAPISAALNTVSRTKAPTPARLGSQPKSTPEGVGRLVSLRNRSQGD